MFLFFPVKFYNSIVHVPNPFFIVTQYNSIMRQTKYVQLPDKISKMFLECSILVPSHTPQTTNSVRKSLTHGSQSSVSQKSTILNLARDNKPEEPTTQMLYRSRSPRTVGDDDGLK